jgi:hypothetical protein
VLRLCCFGINKHSKVAARGGGFVGGRGGVLLTGTSTCTWSHSLDSLKTFSRCFNPYQYKYSTHEPIRLLQLLLKSARRMFMWTRILYFKEHIPIS